MIVASKNATSTGQENNVKQEKQKMRVSKYYLHKVMYYAQDWHRFSHDTADSSSY